MKIIGNPDWRLRHVCVVVFAMSFFALALHPEARLVDTNIPGGAETVRVARSLAEYGTFANPFAAGNTGPTAHVAPIYPFLYALFLKAFGDGYTCLLILWGLTLAVLASQMALLPWLSSQVGLGVAPGLAAAVLGVISIHAAIDTRWEGFFAGLLLMAVGILTVHSSTWATVSGAAFLGIIWGIAVLTNPVAVLLLVAWPLVIIARSSDRRGSLRSLAILFGVAMLVVAPWIARNYARFGAFIFVRDNFGLELALGNNPCASATLAQNIASGCHHLNHPNSNTEAAKLVSSMGEYAFDQAKLQESLNWIRENKSAFASLTIQRVRQVWFPTLERKWEMPIVWCITPLAFVGLARLWRSRRTVALLLGITWVLYPAVYYLVPADPRYLYPIYWTMLLPAGFALTESLRAFSLMDRGTFTARPTTIRNR
jgi:hypothetical protein